MSTAELGLSLAEMIRQDKVQIISCTGANLEEDLFNLVAHDYYERVPHYRDLTPQDEQELLDRHMNRVTDTCIPEHEAMRRLEKAMVDVWTKADTEGKQYFPHEFMYQVLKNGSLEEYYQIDLKDSWMYAAMEKNLPMVVPGWEDSTMGNMFAGHVITGDVENVHTVRTGIEYMMSLAEWYTVNATDDSTVGFFQIGGGIALAQFLFVVSDQYVVIERGRRDRRVALALVTGRECNLAFVLVGARQALSELERDLDLEAWGL